MTASFENTVVTKGPKIAINFPVYGFSPDERSSSAQLQLHHDGGVRDSPITDP
jgi:hypothetical protein